MACLRCGGNHESAKCPYFSIPNKCESVTYCKQCDCDPCECQKRKLMAEQRNKKRLLEMEDDGTPAKRRKLNDAEQEELDSRLNELRKLMMKSNITICSETDDRLTPFVLYNDDQTIPIKAEMLQAIRASKCCISGMNEICDIVIGFIIENDMSFSTMQFLSLLMRPSNLRNNALRSFTENLQFLEKRPKDLFLKESIVEQIDEQRVELTEYNVKNMHGLNENASFEWVGYIRDALSDCSLFRVPVNAALEYGGDMWEFSFVYFIVGRTENGHLIGLSIDCLFSFNNLNVSTQDIHARI